jgi:hypothetical protein
MKTKLLPFLFIFLISLCGLSNAQVNKVIIDTTTHHLGDAPGSEGTFLDVSFVFPFNPTKASLELDFVLPFGPNYENPPVIKINGVDLGSIQPFFPMEGFPNSGGWVENPDASHDYNGPFNISLPATSVLVNGNNLFRIENGRPDDDYFFNNVMILDSLLIGIKNPPTDPDQSCIINNIVIYPNPFTSASVIKYELSEDQTVSVNIFNIYGQLLLQLINERQAAGEHSTVFDGLALPDGAYFIEIRTEKQMAIRKLMHH